MGNSSPIRLMATLFLTSAVSLAGAASNAAATGPTPAEMATARCWVVAKLATPAKAEPQPPGLVVLANHDPVRQNTRGEARPLTIAGAEHRRGLYCHATSNVVVRLPGPGKTFTAMVGVDSNDQTSGGRGSVVFSVTVGGKTAFQSSVMREGMQAVPVQVDLGGATSFALGVSDAGDGISCDQSDWAEAKVTLAGGEEVWLGEMPLIEPVPGGVPFSFVYGDRSSQELLAQWPRVDEEKQLDADRAQRTTTWTDPRTKLEVRCVSVAYRRFPTVEWTLYFRNGDSEDTPILSEIAPLDTGLARPDGGEFLLHHHTGSVASMDDYRPHESPLPRGARLQLATAGGRGSDRCWPYFNLQWDGGGAILAIGWPGQWSATFTRDDATGLRLRAGQENTHFKLLPGEEVRTPLIAMQFYRGDWIRAQNVWRRWMLAHNVPRLDGELPPMLMPGGSSNQMNEMQNANETNQKEFIDGYLDNGVKIDFWWMDAGWYPFRDGWWNTGTWEPDLKRFPNGLRAVSDHAHGRGVKTLVWFEPERVQPGTWLYENRPQWLLGDDGQQKLLNLGLPEARQWVIEMADRLLREQGIDIYRQDFNMAPLDYWRRNDAPDRQGISEIKHMAGYLAFWDELRRRHPGLLIDTCASGGRRNDLETLRRSVPLHKSDMQYPNLTSKQTQFYGIAFWVPYFGAPVYPADRVDVYGFRSGMAPMTGLGYDSRRKDLDYALLRRLVAQRRQLAPNYYGDYYPLTSWSAAPDVWMAWQLDRPEAGQGMVQAFRRPESVYERARFRLRGLEVDARYTVRNLDAAAPTEATGRELMEDGLPVSIEDRPGAVVITYQRATAEPAPPR
ncbi:MAG: NPCBM/NEW2 domain-containing protein [Pirellulales bacterium]|nr:NPCBM/NEW2 domain-containing protein [Pirellulales bacterium]